jgi:hypothetical protein
VKTATKLVSALLLLGGDARAPAARADTYDTAILVTITPQSQADAQVLYDGGIDILGVTDGKLKALVTADQLRELKSRGFGVEILYAEMQEDRARWAEANASSFVTSYYTASKFNTINPPAGSLMEHLLEQHNAHPDVTRLYNLGASEDGPTTSSRSRSPRIPMSSRPSRSSASTRTSTATRKAGSW